MAVMVSGLLSETMAYLIISKDQKKTRWYIRSKSGSDGKLDFSLRDGGILDVYYLFVTITCSPESSSYGV